MPELHTLPNATDSDHEILAKIANNLGVTTRWSDKDQAKKATAARGVIEKIQSLEASKPTPIADKATAYALTGVAVGTVYKTTDTGQVMEYMGGGESDPSNWRYGVHTNRVGTVSMRDQHPFSMTNTGGGNLQAQDTIPKLWDWAAVITAAGGPPEFYSGGSGTVDLTTLVLGSKVTEIGQAEFLQCSNLVGTIVFPDSCTIIGSDQSYGSGNGAFSSCTGITGLVFGAGLVTLFDNEFQGCTAITSIGFNEGLTTIGTNCFRSCSAISTMTLPSTLDTVGDDAFNGCTSLASVTIPAAVTAIPHGMFDGCTALATINCLATAAPTLGTDAFLNVAASDIHVPVGATGYGATYGGLTVILDL